MGVFIHKKGYATIAPWRFNPLVSPTTNIKRGCCFQPYHLWSCFRHIVTQILEECIVLFCENDY